MRVEIKPQGKIKRLIKKYMELELQEKLNQQEKKMEKIFKSVEKTRKYFLWALIATVFTFVLPLLAFIAIIPWFLKIITSAYS